MPGGASPSRRVNRSADEIAEVQNGIAHSGRCEVHHGITDVPDLNVEQCDQVAVGLVHLARIPHDHRFSALTVDRSALEPAEHELHQRIRGVLAFTPNLFEPRYAVAARPSGVGERSAPAATKGSIGSRCKRAKVPIVTH